MQCADQYTERADRLTPSGPVTPVLIERWAESYQEASALAAEGDVDAAATACRQLLRAMDDVLG